MKLDIVACPYGYNDAKWPALLGERYVCQMGSSSQNVSGWNSNSIYNKHIQETYVITK